jgi:HlyD family secretion protein
LAVAEASVKQADATRAEAATTLKRQREVFKLSGGKVPSKTEMETAQAELTRADANLASAKAKVTQARATLRSDETNLEKATIRSPIDGVVLSREVEPGQTVAASYQAPVLFTLAEDLKRMELQVDVDEADVGKVDAGQQAEFTVDAYANRKYPANISRVRYGATTTDNVVTYLTVLQVDNDDLSLRPGMTASAVITTKSLKDVLLVPNAALRFTPPRNSGEEGRSLVSSLLPHRPRREKNVRLSADENGQRQIWVLRNGQATAVRVTTGDTDGRVTQILGGDLHAGDRVITGTLIPAQ